MCRALVSGSLSLLLFHLSSYGCPAVFWLLLFGPVWYLTGGYNLPDASNAAGCTNQTHFIFAFMFSLCNLLRLWYIFEKRFSIHEVFPGDAAVSLLIKQRPDNRCDTGFESLYFASASQLKVKTASWRQGTFPVGVPDLPLWSPPGRHWPRRPWLRSVRPRMTPAASLCYFGRWLLLLQITPMQPVLFQKCVCPLSLSGCRWLSPVYFHI